MSDDDYCDHCTVDGECPDCDGEGCEHCYGSGLCPMCEEDAL